MKMMFTENRIFFLVAILLSVDVCVGDSSSTSHITDKGSGPSSSSAQATSTGGETTASTQTTNNGVTKTQEVKNGVVTKDETTSQVSLLFYTARNSL